MEKTKLIEKFSLFAKEYSFDDPIIALKFNHGLSVANFSYDIAKSLMMPEEDCKFAFAFGLIHELGSFENWLENKTYQNNKLTKKLLFGKKLINNFDIPKKYHKFIKFILSQDNTNEIDYTMINEFAKKYSNIKKVYTQTLAFAKILKDANILDYFGMIKRKSLPPVIVDYKKQSLSKEFLIAYKTEQFISSDGIRSLPDLIVYQICLYFNLSFYHSIKFANKIDFANAIYNLYKIDLSPKQDERILKLVTSLKNKIEN